MIFENTPTSPPCVVRKPDNNVCKTSTTVNWMSMRTIQHRKGAWATLIVTLLHLHTFNARFNNFFLSFSELVYHVKLLGKTKNIPSFYSPSLNSEIKIQVHGTNTCLKNFSPPCLINTLLLRSEESRSYRVLPQELQMLNSSNTYDYFSDLYVNMQIKESQKFKVV